MRLTDEQCNKYRRQQKTSNDMIRAVYEAGQKAAMAEMAGYKEKEFDRGYEAGYRAAEYEGEGKI